MIGSKWFHEPDDERESWCFLTLEQDCSANSSIIGWRMGYGNLVKMVRTLENEGSDEREVILELLEEFSYCRRENITLITDGSDVLQRLRTRILASNVPSVSLKGIRQISIESVLENYFEGVNSLKDLASLGVNIELREENKLDGRTTKNPKLLWRIFLKIGPLLPKGGFRDKSRTL